MEEHAGALAEGAPAVGGRHQAEHGDRRRGLGASGAAQSSPETERERAPRALLGTRVLEREEREERARPDAQEEGHLHPAPQGPREHAEPQDDGREQERQRAHGAALGAPLGDAQEELPPHEQHAEHADHRDHGRPLHQVQLAEAGDPAEGQHERVGEARVARGVAVADAPLEGIALRRRSRVVEMDEDVVQRGGPLAARLSEHVAVEHARRRERADRREEHVERPVHAEQPAPQRADGP